MTRRAFTTVELMVVLAIGGLIASGIVTVLRRQQRFFTNTASLVEQRVSLRDATGILPGELRSLSPVDGDVLAFSDSALEIRATIGAAIVCDTLPGGAGVALAPARAGTTQVLASFATTPQPGDVALVYDARDPNRLDDAGWAAFEIAAVTSSVAVCATSPFVEARGASTPRLQLRFIPSARAPASLGPGAFARILRRARYRFYRASTGDWYLGYSEWDGTAFGVVQPVSGPFATYSRRGGSGLTLRYFDDQGSELFTGSDPARIARIDVVARGIARAGLSGTAASATDSQSIAVRVRNR